MASQRTSAPEGDRLNHPEQWATGNEPMTEAQREFPQALGRRAGVGVDREMTKAGASQLIDELKERAGAGGETK